MGKITKIFPLFCIFCASVLDICLGVEDYETSTQNFNLTSIEIIRNYGYPAEVHKVQTEDGYILELHRIPHGKFSDSKRGIPILLVHGLLASSIEFLLLETNSLAFVLADAGYDVWMVNFRGSTYSRNHTNLQADDKKFWNFSWHENGVYDIPSSIDYVCNYTQRDQLLYIGFSMGTTAFFVTASMRPEYQEKLQGAILLGPTAYVKHTKSPIRLLAPFSKTIKGLSDFIGTGGVLEQTPELQNLLKVLCKPLFMCKNFLFMVAGRDSRGFQNEVIPKAVTHIPAGTSVKTAAHYGQLVMSGKFRQYDYGILSNLRRYHQIKPPIYNLEAITTPLSLFVAPNDVFSTRRDLERLLQRLHSVKNVHVIPSPKFTHIDFVVSKNVNELFYPDLLKEVEQLMSHGTVAKPVQKRSEVHRNKVVPNMNYNQDHCNMAQNIPINQDKVRYNPIYQITVNDNVVDKNKMVYNEPRYNPADRIKYVYSMGNINYNPADYNVANQNEIVFNEAEQNENVYNEANPDEIDYNEANPDEINYNEANLNEIDYNDRQYNQAVYNEDRYNQDYDQDEAVYNPAYNPAAYNTINQNEIVFSEAEQNKNVYSDDDYNVIDQNEVVYNEANPGEIDYNNGQYNQADPIEAVYHEDQYSQDIDQDKVVYNADFNPAACNSVDQNEIVYNGDDQNEIVYNEDDQNEIVYNEDDQNEIVYNEDDQNEIVYNEDDQNEDFYKEVGYIPLKYKKFKYFPLNYKNVDYSGAQYSDF